MNNPADTAEPAEQSPVSDADVDANLDMDVDSIDSQNASPADGEEPEKQTILEMRQVAGLTAGSVMGLHRGSFQFRESDKEVGFSLTVNEVDDVIVVGGSAVTVVDEIQVEQPTPLGDAVLNVGSACFTVRPLRSEPTAEARMAALVEARIPPKAIPVPEFVEESSSPVQTRSSRFGSLFGRDADDDTESPLDGQSWRFLESIRDVRSLVAERHRHLHPNPEELKSRLDRLDPGLWDRTIEHPLFARFPIAYSTIPWQPRFDDPDRIPQALHGPIQEMSCLPWVPITANLLNGPLGIVGSRPAVLACARNAVLSLACLSSPSDIEFSIVTAQGLVVDWDWTSSLPNSLFPNDESNYCIAVADGMAHFDGAGLDPEAVKENEMGLIVLEESVEDLPDYCGTILQITSEGQCQVTNHLGEQIVGTPIGVAAGFGAATASLIRMAIGDEVAEEPADEMQSAEENQTAEATVADDVEDRSEQDESEESPQDEVATATLIGGDAQPEIEAEARAEVESEIQVQTQATDRAKAIIDNVLADDDELNEPAADPAREPEAAGQGKETDESESSEQVQLRLVQLDENEETDDTGETDGPGETDGTDDTDSTVDTDNADSTDQTERPEGTELEGST